MRIRLGIIFISIFCNACLGLAAVGVATAAGVGVQKVVGSPVVALRTGSVVLDSVTWSRVPEDSTKLAARGMLTWKKAKMGPNNTPYLSLDALTALTGMGQQAATGMFQVDLVGADGKVMQSVAQSTLTVWDGKDPIKMIPADKAFWFDMRTTPIAWNILRDARSKTIKFVVATR
jgi:hypothetical protein